MSGRKKRRETRCGPQGRADAVEWARLYPELYPQVRSSFLSRVADAQDAEDLTQQVFAELARGQTPDNLQVYVDGVASRLLSRYRRRRATERAVLRELLLEAISAEDERQPHEARGPSVGDESRVGWDDFLAEVLAGLLPEEAELLRLRFVEGLRVAEVARQMGCSREAAYKRLQRTIRRLREHYGVQPNPKKTPRE